MASRSIKRFRSATCLASALLLPGIAVAAPSTTLASDAAKVSVIPDVPSASADKAKGADLYLEVVLNGNPTDKIAHFLQYGSAFRASAETLRQLGFRLPAAVRGSINLLSLPGVSAVDYDVADQRLSITAAPDLIDQSAVLLNAHANAIPQPTASPGLLLNYDLYGTRGSRGNSSVAAYTELRAFSAQGVLSNTALSRWADSSNPGTTNDSVRLDTNFSHSFVDSALTLRIGDIIAGSLDWTRATRLGGIQLQRNFALQPQLITFPVPAFYGQANLPSSVDLYINGLKQYSSKVPAGPFQLDTVPTVNGDGQAQVVITDAMGRQSAIAFPYYTTNQLLRTGLSDYSVEAGFAREDYGLRSFGYAADPAFSGTYRRGMANWLTLAGHAEATTGLADGGGGAVIAIGGAGVINASFAASQDHGASGRQAELGYNWRNERFNFSLDSLRTFGAYRDVASRYGPPPPRRSDRVLAGFTLGRPGSLGVSYVALEYPGQPRSRYASAYYFISLGQRAALNLSVNQNLDDHGDRSVFLGLSVALDNRVSASLYVGHDRSGNSAALDANQPINPDGGFGWHVRAQDGSADYGGLAELGYRGEDGEIRSGVQSLSGSTLGYADLNGALVFMDHQFFFAKQINDAFAVVSTNGTAGVPVMLENRPIGTTNARGDLLVTPLNAYQRNKLSIDPMQLPADVQIDRVDAEVVPSDRAGTLVKFGIEAVRAASVILHAATGKPIEVGSSVTLRGSGAPAMLVGYDGMVYLEGLGEHDVLDVQTPHGRCEAQLDYHPNGSTVPVIGPLACQEAKP